MATATAQPTSPTEATASSSWVPIAQSSSWMNIQRCARDGSTVLKRLSSKCLDQLGLEIHRGVAVYAFPGLLEARVIALGDRHRSPKSSPVHGHQGVMSEGTIRVGEEIDRKARPAAQLQ